MKRDMRNPGGEGPLDMSMKGCETGMDRGKGGISNKGYANGPPWKHQGLESPSKIEGMVKGGHVRNTGHALTSIQGNIGPVGTSKACK